ncbi:PLP-dependent transferase [Mycena filopes]|nr:PLP-dependent transferase [Mycena filopes]
MSPVLSDRARRRLDLPAPHVYTAPPGPYYDSEHYPEGIINLSTAENSLLSDRLIEHMSRPLAISRQHLKYRYTLLKTGLPTVEDLLPEYVNDHFNPVVPVTRKNSVTGPGIGAVLAQLIWALVNENAGVLISAPFYVMPYLEKALLKSVQDGVKIEVLLLCNPHNPLPQVVARDVVQGYALFAEKHGLHLIVDEVYGLSTFESAFPPVINAKFESILSYDLPALGVDPSRVHVLAGPTKDFGASGFKLGLLISPANPELITLMRPLFNATPISAASDLLFARVLGDKPFVECFLADNRAALSAAYEFVARWMIFHDLPFTRANAGVYILVDLASFIARIVDPAHGDTTNTEKLDRAVATMLEHKVFLKPTALMADPIPTRFRLVFT